MSSKTYVSKAFDFFFKQDMIFQSPLKKYAPNTITQQGQEERKTQKGRRILIKSFFSHLTKSDAEIISLIGFRSQGNIGSFPTKIIEQASTSRIKIGGLSAERLNMLSVYSV